MKKFPNAFVIIISVIVLSWILTNLIPQGAYQRVTDSKTGLTKVVSNSYEQITSQNLSVFDLLVAIPKGITGRADVIVLILLLGGSFYIIEKTGALNQGLNKLVRLLKGKEVIALILVSALFTATGATIGMQEELIAMMPILLLFGRSLGYDVFTTLYMSYGSTVLGSSFSPSNPFAVLVAQKEAGLPLLSGSELRFVVLFIAFTVWILYLLQYSKKNRVEKISMSSTHDILSLRSKAILISLGITFGIVIYGLLELEWGFNELSASFFGLGIVSG
ncbi:MAG: YfcC family protein, partial [Maribacter sp.]